MITTVGTNVIDEKSWSAVSTVVPFATRTLFPLVTAEIGHSGSPHFTLFLSSVLIKDVKSLNLIASS